MKKIFAYGESLLRWDVSPNDKIKRFPTGTALNFLSNMQQLQNQNCHLITAFSNKKDSEIFTNFLKMKKIDYQDSFIAQNKNIGSYTIFRTPTIFGWEVVYNRIATCWTEFLESNQENFLNSATANDHLHFDGISLLVHQDGYQKIKKLIAKARKLKMTISFDFNLRWTLASTDVLTKYKDVISQIDYLNISSYDINNLLNKKLDQEINLHELKEKFPNLKAIFGYQKKAHKQEMTILGYLLIDDEIEFTKQHFYKPNDLIGQGDAFSAFIINQILRNEKPDINEALNWSIFKTFYLGDANVPTTEDFLLWKKQVNIIR